MAEWSEIPSALRRFDAKPGPRCPEAVITQIVWSCLPYFPSLPALLSVPPSLDWESGKHGCGDLSGTDDNNEVRAHLEFKSDAAAINPGSHCHHNCGQYVTQFHHMAHDQQAVILAFTHSRRVPRLRAEIADAGLIGRVQVRSFTQLADAIEGALAADGPPPGDLLSVLLDVQEDG